MSDLSDIHEKINASNIIIARIDERLSSTLPNLVTKSDLSTAISVHRSECRASSPPAPKGVTTMYVKVILALVAALGALTAAMSLLR